MSGPRRSVRQGSYARAAGRPARLDRARGERLARGTEAIADGGRICRGKRGRGPVHPILAWRSAMSATRRRCSRCSGWAWRCGRSTPCSFPTTRVWRRGTGQVFTGAAVRDVVDGIAARGVLRAVPRCSAATWAIRASGEAVLRCGRPVRAANPAALYCCDPVIGDARPGVYVRAASRLCCATAACRPADIAHAEPVRAGAADRCVSTRWRPAAALRAAGAMRPAPRRAGDEPAWPRDAGGLRSTCWPATPAGA